MKKKVKDEYLLLEEMQSRLLELFPRKEKSIISFKYNIREILDKTISKNNKRNLLLACKRIQKFASAKNEDQVMSELTYLDTMLEELLWFVKDSRKEVNNLIKSYKRK